MRSDFSPMNELDKNHNLTDSFIFCLNLANLAL